MKRFLLSFLSALTIVANGQIRLSYIDPSTQEIRIENFGPMSIDIANYRLCALFEYANLNQPSVTILSGDFNLATGEEVAITWSASGGFNVTASDIGLYLPNGSFGSASAMVDFMQYGAGGQGRENVAVTAGIWTAGTFLDGSGPWYYTGNGQTSGIDQWTDELTGPATDVRINELDMDQPGTDNDEFIELFGVPGTSLDGLALVFFTGASNTVYDAYDLDGFSIGDNGFFVLGSSTVPNVDMILNGPIENGEDAVALFAADASQWPGGTPVGNTGLVDALVYGTDDPDDAELLAALTPNQPQLDATPNTGTSFSRVPDGGTAFDMSVYVQQDPTPGVSNIPPCVGGQVTLTEGNSEQCLEDSDNNITLSTNSLFGDNYIWFVAGANDTIIVSSSSSVIDMNLYGIGEFHIYGFSYNGNLNSATVAEGSAVTDAMSDDCYSLSANFITITRTACQVDVCDGGQVTTSDNNTYISLCLDSNEDIYDFSYTIGGNADSYTYFLTDDNGLIIQQLDEGFFDFNALTAGSYRVYGLSFFTGLDPATIEAGDPLTGIVTLGSCLDLSDNFVEVNALNCELGEGCSRLFISEYFEGNSQDKALEIYNPTPFPVDLSDYDLLMYTNGAIDFTAVAALSGTLQPGDVYVVANSQASAAILAEANLTGNIATFNGNDAIVLTYNLNPVDIVGVIGEDPGNQGWIFGNNSTTDHVLVRNINVSSPTTNWALSQGQWTAFPISEYTTLGQHSAQGCGGEAFVSFVLSSIQVEETVGAVELVIQAYNVTVDVPITVSIEASSANEGEDFTSSLPTTLTFTAANNIQSLSIDIVDDLLEEELFEFITITLSDDDDLATFVNQSVTISIVPSDLDYPFYPIGEIAGNNADGELDSLGVFCSIGGVVHGINFNPSGTEFTLIDGTGGIKVFDADQSFGYTVLEGDSVVVSGQVAQFEGMAFFYPNLIEYIDGGHPLELPQTVTVLDESYESHMVRIECVEMVDPTQWTQVGNGFDVELTDGTNEFTMRVDLNTDIFQSEAPQGHFTIVGIGAQFDPTSPYSGGYTFWPRYLDDFSDVVEASFQMPTVLVYDDSGLTVDFVNSSEGATSYSWEFGDGSTLSSESPSHDYSYAFLSTVAEVTVSLTVSNGAGCSDVFTATVDVVYSSVNEETAGVVQIFPNPSSDFVFVNTSGSVGRYRLLDTQGRTVISGDANRAHNFRFDISAQSQGVYLLELESDGILLRQRVVRK
jgi:hypothetical protein